MQTKQRHIIHIQKPKGFFGPIDLSNEWLDKYFEENNLTAFDIHDMGSYYSVWVI